MPTEASSLYAFTAGVVDRRGLSRVELRRLSLAAETQTNWLCRVIGRMSLRPGLRYIGGLAGNPEVASESAGARAELFMLAEGAGGARAAAAGSAGMAVGAKGFPGGASDGGASIVVAVTGVGDT